MKDILRKTIAARIQTARLGLYREINRQSILMLWDIGNELNNNINDREGFDETIQRLEGMCAYLRKKFSKQMFTVEQLFEFMNFAKIMPDIQIAEMLSKELVWGHIRELLLLKQHKEREFYLELCLMAGWTEEALHRAINENVYNMVKQAKDPGKEIDKVVNNFSNEKFNMENVLGYDIVRNMIGFKPVSDIARRDIYCSEVRECLMEENGDLSFVNNDIEFILNGNVSVIDMVFYDREFRRLIFVKISVDENDFSMQYFKNKQMTYLYNTMVKSNEEKPVGIYILPDNNSCYYFVQYENSAEEVNSIEGLPLISVLVKRLKTVKHRLKFIV